MPRKRTRKPRIASGRTIYMKNRITGETRAMMEHSDSHRTYRRYGWVRVTVVQYQSWLAVKEIRDASDGD